MDYVIRPSYEDFLLYPENNMYNISMGNNTNYHNVTMRNLYISEDTLLNIKFVIGMIFIPLFSLFGSIGNIFSLIVIFHQTYIQRLRNSTNICLAALAVSDLLFLIHCLLFAGINVHIYLDPFEGKNVRAMMFPIFGAYGSLVTARITTLMTLLLSVERFIAVYFPMKAKVICNHTVTVIAVCIIYILTSLLFLPYVFKYKVHYFLTRTNQTRAVVVPQKDNFYQIYGIAMNVLFRFFPILLLIIMNILILLVIRKTWRQRKAISNVQSSVSGVSEQHHITIMLLTVSFIFLVCILPGAVSSIFTHIYPEYNRGRLKRDIYEFVNYITYLLETVNSSINFIIYMALSKRFCKTYKRIFCCQKRYSFSSLGSNRSKFSFSHDRNASYNREHDQLIMQKNGGSIISLETKYTADYNDRRNSHENMFRHPRMLRKKSSQSDAFRKSHSQNSIERRVSSSRASPSPKDHVKSCCEINVNSIHPKSLKVSPTGSKHSQLSTGSNSRCASCEYQMWLSMNGHNGTNHQELSHKLLQNGHANGHIKNHKKGDKVYNDDFV